MDVKQFQIVFRFRNYYQRAEILVLLHSLAGHSNSFYMPTLILCKHWNINLKAN